MGMLKQVFVAAVLANAHGQNASTEPMPQPAPQAQVIQPAPQPAPAPSPAPPPAVSQPRPQPQPEEQPAPAPAPAPPAEVPSPQTEQPAPAPAPPAEVPSPETEQPAPVPAPAPAPVPLAPAPAQDPAPPAEVPTPQTEQPAPSPAPVSDPTETPPPQSDDPAPAPAPPSEPECEIMSCRPQLLQHNRWMRFCPFHHVMQGMVECGDEECIQAADGADGFCFSKHFKAKCCVPKADSDCEWFEACNFGGIKDMFSRSDTSIEDLWAGLPSDLQHNLVDARRFGYLGAGKMKIVGKEIIASIRTTAFMRGFQFEGIAEEISAMSADDLRMFLKNVNANALEKGVSSLGSAGDWDATRATLVAERCAGTDVFGDFSDWTVIQIYRLRGLIAYLSPELVSKFADWDLSHAWNVNRLTGAQLIGMTDKLMSMKMRYFKRICRHAHKDALAEAYEHWEANGEVDDYEREFIEQFLQRDDDSDDRHDDDSDHDGDVDDHHDDESDDRRLTAEVQV